MKKKFTKSLVAMFALVAMLTQNAYGVYAAATSPAPIVENEFADDEASTPDIEVVTDAGENTEEGTEVEYVDGDLDVDEIAPTDDVSYDDEVMPIDEDVEEEEIPENIEILDTQISGSGLDSVEIYIDTDELNSKDTFRIEFTSDAAASYDTILNEELSKSAGGYYTFSNLDKLGFNIRVNTSDEIEVIFTTNGSTPTIKLISKSEDKEKVLETKSLTSDKGSPISAIYGEGYDEFKLNLVTDSFKDDTKYTLYVETEASAKIDGKSVSDGIKGLDADTSSVVIADLEGESFTAYAVSEDKDVILYTQATVDNVDDGEATIKIALEEEVRVKRVYTYSDDKVYVTATLENPEAVPDDAEFKVTPISNQDAIDAYLEALNNNADEDSIEYTEENTFLYDIAFLVEEEDEDGNVKKVEFEPEVGSVTIDIKFKKSQLSDELGAEASEDISVNHLPLKESVKNDVDKTIDAIDINASDIIVEEIDATVNVTENGADSVKFVADSFSAYAVINNGKSKYEYMAGTSRDYKTIMGSAIAYGIVANKIIEGGHFDANYATKHFNAGNDNTTAGAYTGNKNPGNYIMADFSGTSAYHMYNSDGNKVSIVRVPSDDSNKDGKLDIEDHGANLTLWREKNNRIDYSKTKAQLESDVDSLLKNGIGAMSSALASEADANVYTGTSYFVDNNKTGDDKEKKDGWIEAAKRNGNTIDLTESEGGTYYFNYNDYTNSGFCGKDSLKVKIKDNQTVVFNIPDKTINNLFGVYMTIVSSDGTENSRDCGVQDSSAAPFTKHFVFNCYNATSINLQQTCGMILAPKAHVYASSVATGWIGCDIFENGAEFHGVWDEMPESFTENTEIQFSVEKTLYNINADEEEPFEFVLYETDTMFYSDNKDHGTQKKPVELGRVTISSYDANHKGTATFADIEYNSVGKHYYVIKEEMNGNQAANWYAENGVYAHIEVDVKSREVTVDSVKTTSYYVDSVKYSYNVDRTSGAKLDNPVSLSTATPTVSFINSKHKTTTGLELPVTKAMKDKATGTVYSDWPVNETFNFKIEPLTQAQVGSKNNVTYPGPMPSRDVISVTSANKTASFIWPEGTFQYAEVCAPGLYPYTRDEDNGLKTKVYPQCYMYKVYEVIPTNETPGVVYDQHVQYVKLWVDSCSRGSLKWVEVSVNGSLNLDKCGGTLNRIDFVNEYEKLGKLAVTKTVTGAASNDTTAFSFKVKKGSAYIRAAKDTDGEYDATIATGAVDTFTFKNGETVTFKNLELGTYTVEEITTGMTIGYAYVSTTNGVATVNNNETAEVTVTNAKQYVEKEVVGTKVVTNKKTGASITGNLPVFTFTVTPDASNPANGCTEYVTKFASDATGAISALDGKKFKFVKAGTYKFTVKENAFNYKGFSMPADSNERVLEFVVTEDQTTKALEVSTTSKLELTFTNNYDKSGSTQIVINKTLAGREITADDIKTFKFDVYESTVAGAKGTSYGSYYLPNASVGKNSGSVTVPLKKKVATGLADFELSDAGTDFYYLIVEEKASKDVAGGITEYNPTGTQYLVKVTVDDNREGENLTVTPYVASKNGDAAFGTFSVATSVSFTNVHTAPDKYTFVVNKELSGYTLKTGETKTFYFAVQEKDENNSWKTVKQLSYVVSNPAQAQTTNTYEAEYNSAKTHEYRIVETDASYKPYVEYADGEVKDSSGNVIGEVKTEGGKKVVLINNILCDTTVDTTTVTVTKDDTNHKFTVADALGSNTKTVTYKNIYEEPKPTKFSVNGYKKLQNLASATDTFTITMYEADSSFTKGEVVGTPFTTNGNEDFSFADIPVEGVGPYYYVVEETQPSGTGVITNAGGKKVLNNIEYDNVVYHITVTAADNGKGQLVPTVVTTLAGALSSTTGNPAVTNFVNKYIPDGTYQIEAKKVIESLKTDVSKDRYKFKLYEVDGTKETVVAQSATDDNAKITDTNGNVTFDPISYSLDDFGDNDTIVRNYVVREDVTNKVKGYEYDVYNGASVQVTLTKSETNGTVSFDEPSIVYTNNSALTSDADYAIKALIANKYEAEGTVTIDGLKTLSPATLKLKDFDTFTVGLYADEACDDTTLLATADVDKKTGKFSFTLPADATGNAKTTYNLGDINAEYTYYVKEIEPATKSAKNADIKYSNDVVTVHYSLGVNAQDSSLIEAQKMTYTGGKATDKAQILNEEVKPGEVTFKALKNFSGKNNFNGKFKFTLEEKVDGNWTKLDEVTNNGALVEFKNAKATKKYTVADVGTYHYFRITELQDTTDAMKGYKYATDGKSVYTVVVEVKETDGQVEPKATYYVGDVADSVASQIAAKEEITATKATDQTQAVFTNAYEGTGSIEFKGTKYLNDKTGENVPEFTFTLYESDSSFSTKNAMGEKYVVKNDSTGAFAFPAIKYTQASLSEESTLYNADSDTYEKYYIISESENYPYSTDSDVKIKVTLTAQDNGVINAVGNATKANTNFVDISKWYNKLYVAALKLFKNDPTAIRFDNYYAATGSVNFSVIKAFASADGKSELSTIENNILKSETYKFTLEEDGVALREATIKGTDVAAGFVADFATINYTSDPSAQKKAKKGDAANVQYAAGPHTYKIYEEKVTAAGIKENTEVYTAKVTVDKDENSDKLLVSTVITKKVDGQADSTFSYSNNSTVTTGEETSNSGACDNEAVTFTNRMKEDHDSVPVRGLKTLTESLIAYNSTLADAQKQTYTFTLTRADNKEFRVVSGSTVSTVSSLTAESKGGEFGFDKELYFDESDYANSSISFVITETTPVAPVQAVTGSVSFDVNVAINNGKLTATIADAPKDNRFEFINDYTNDGTFNIVGNKSVTPSSMELSEYTFYLVDCGTDLVNGNVTKATAARAGYSEVTLADNNKVYAKSATNGTTGASKGVIEFTSVENLKPTDLGKTFYYMVVEDKAGQTIEGVKYSEAVYYVKAEVKVLDDGKLGAVPEYYTSSDLNADSKVSGMSFVNEYTAKAPATITGSKKLLINGIKDGLKPFAEGVFKAELYDKYPPAEGEEPLAIANISATNAQNIGEFTFTGDEKANPASAEYNTEFAAGKTYVKELAFNQDNATPNPHTFYVKEFIPTVDERGKIEYDETVFVASFTVSDNKKGELTVSAPEYKIYGETESGIWAVIKELADPTTLVFENTYKPTKCEWDPSGIKDILGRSLNGGEFTFELVETAFTQKDLDGNVIKTYTEKELKHSVTTKNKADASIKFDNKDAEFLQYKDASAIGTHVYEVHELESGLASVKDSGTKYTFTVEVTDVNGELKVTTPVTRVLSETDTSEKEKTLINEHEVDFAFHNKYSATAVLDLYGTKIMEGRDITDSDKFSFTLDQIDADGTAIAGKHLDATNNGQQIVFTHTDDMLSYTESDAETNETFRYLVKETPVHSNGVDSDDTVQYLVKVTVDYNRDDAGNIVHDGNLKLSVQSAKVDKNLNGSYYNVVANRSGSDVKLFVTGDNTFEFKNSYEAKGDITLAGKKHIKYTANGNDVTTEKLSGYYFMVFEYDSEADRTRNDNSHRAQLGNSVESASDGNYSIKLEYNQDDLRDKLTNKYSDSKTHYLKVFEYNPVNKGYHTSQSVVTVGEVTYDLKEYDVNVTVSKSADPSKLDVVATCDSGSFNAATKTFGGLDYTNIITRTTKISGTKYWRDGLADTAVRPDVVLTLKANGVVKDTYTIKHPERTYEFTNLPVNDENGKITYTVEEAVIDGYTSNTQPTDHGFDFYNTAGRIRIRKISAETGEPLEGAVLAIIDAAGNEVERWTTDLFAHPVEAKLTAGASYRLREISAPTGYLVADDVTFTAPTEGEITVTMEDERIRGRVRLTKRDADTRETLAGATFALYTEAGERVYAAGTAGMYRYSATSGNGVFAVNGSGVLEINELPYGSYYFTELSAPSGYALSSERVSFSILEADALSEVTFLNSRERGAVRLTKISTTSGRTLAGAVFELYAKTPTSASAAIASTIYRDAYYRVGTYTTDASGTIYVGDLPWDDYYFVEVQAPEGYEISRDVNGDPLVYTFTVGEGGARDMVYDLGSITNSPTPETPPTPPTPPRRGEVRGERRDRGRRDGGVLSGVLGVRAAPKSGVLGERLGPVTGDAANIFLWMLLLLASVGAIVGVFIANARRKRNAAR